MPEPCQIAETYLYRMIEGEFNFGFLNPGERFALYRPLSFLDISIPHFLRIVNPFFLVILHDIFNIYVCIL